MVDPDYFHEKKTKLQKFLYLATMFLTSSSPVRA
jgi:hypothetical protein